MRQREGFFYGLETKKKGDFSYNIMTPERALIELIKEKKTFTVLPYGIRRAELKKLAKENTSQSINNVIEKLCS